MNGTNGNEKKHGDGDTWGDIWAGATVPRTLYTDGIPRTFAQLWQRCYFEDLRGMLEESGPGEGRFLELGSGRGTTSMYLVSVGNSVVMLDVAPSAFVLARSGFEMCAIDLPSMVASNAERAGLKAASFDCIYSIGLLEHFEDPRPILEEILRLLKPGGLAFQVIVPKRGPFTCWLPRLLLNPVRFGLKAARATGTWRLQRKGASSLVFRNEWRRRDYLHAARELGAVDVKCLPYNSYSGVYSDGTMPARIALAIYRGLFALKRRVARPPWLRTFAGNAICDLLTFRRQ